MSDTPRTDEVWGNMHGSGYQMMLLAQKLERKLAELQNAFEDAVTAREQVEQERDKHFAASKAQNADITALQTELAEVKRESLKLSALVVERDYQITLANKGYDYEGAVEDARHYKELAAALREELAEAKSNLREVRDCANACGSAAAVAMFGNNLLNRIDAAIKGSAT